jgi:exodeoxyribonuclease V gamma subunit
MELNYYTATSSEILMDKFSQKIRTESSIFASSFVCIGHKSNKDWIIENTIERNAILGNVVFQNPTELVQTIFKILVPKEQRKEILKPQQLKWIIFSLLGNVEFQKQFQFIADYCNKEEQKIFGLAEKLSQLFMSYQEFDADLLESFEQGIFDNEHADWQAVLWKSIKSKINNEYIFFHESLCVIDKYLQQQEFIDILINKVPSIHCIGNIVYTKNFIHLLKLLGQYIEVSVYSTNFSLNSTSSRFIANNNQFQIHINELFKEEGINAINLESKVISNPKSLLHLIQNEIISGKFEPNHQIDSENDDSIQIANSYTEYREVEALWNYLVNQFESNSNLGQREVCVIIPKIETYAPAIKAVFENKQLKIAYTFYDTNLRIQDSPYKALVALFNFDANEFTSKRVYGLLEFKYIREKFGFNEDLSIVKKAISQANIYHGFDGDTELETNLISWKYGLKKVIYGACLEKTNQLVNFEGDNFYPISEFEDSNMLELLRLNSFVEKLYAFTMGLKKRQTLSEWHKFIYNTIDDFLAISEYEPAFFDKELAILSSLNSLDINHEVDFRVIRMYLNKVFDSIVNTEKIGFGGIRFITPNPLLIPNANILCFLGFNGSDFPRNTTKLSFDLLQENKKISSNKLDKNLFLNLIQGTKDKLYLSYIGKSVKDNKKIPPSTIIEDLIQVCKRYGYSEEYLLIEHPLHTFSSMYNSSESKNLIRYDLKDSSILADIQTSKINDTPDLKKIEGRIVIQLNDLIRFMEDPVKYYYNKKLEIYYSDFDVDLQEEELFSLDNIQEWFFKDQFLSRNLSGEQNSDTLFEEYKLKGQFPLVNFKTAQEQDIIDETDKLTQVLNTLNLSHPAPVEINIEIGERFLVQGKIDYVFGDTFLFATVSSDKWKYKLRAVLNFIILHSQYQTVKGKYVSKDRIYKIKDLVVSENRFDDLNKICSLFEKGNNEIIYGTIGFDNKFLDSLESGVASFEEEANKELNDSYSKYYPSEYFKKEFDNEFFKNSASFEQFKEFYLFTNELVNKYIG